MDTDLVKKAGYVFESVAPSDEFTTVTVFMFCFLFPTCLCQNHHLLPPCSCSSLTGLPGSHPPGAVCDPFPVERDHQSASLAAEFPGVRHGDHGRADASGEASGGMSWGWKPFYSLAQVMELHFGVLQFLTIVKHTFWLSQNCTH